MTQVAEAVREEWRRRVIAEYGSAGVTHSLLAGSCGWAPPSLVPCPESLPMDGEVCAAPFGLHAPPACPYIVPGCGEVIAYCDAYIGDIAAAATWTVDPCGAGGQPGAGGADDGGASVGAGGEPSVGGAPAGGASGESG